MACVTKFDDKIPFECIGEIISEVRGGNGNARSIGKKAAWIAGCLMEVLDGVIDLPDVVTQQTEDEKLDTLELYFGPSAQKTPDRPENIPPEVWAILIQLLLKWLGGGFGRRR